MTMNDFSFETVHDDERKAFRNRVVAEGYVWNEEMQMGEHRAIAIKALNHVLITDLHVHHIDHNKKNNKPENLIVLSATAHEVVHVCTMFFPFPNGGQRYLLKPENLLKFLDDAHMHYEYVGGI